jgi:drug/metabolite transporter (DMT)-like permease
LYSDSLQEMNERKETIRPASNAEESQASAVRWTTQVGPHLALIVVQLLFGTWPIVGKIVLRSLPSTGLVAFRVVGGAIALVFMQQFRKKSGPVSKADLGWLALCSLLGVALNQLFFVKGLSLTTVINATLLGTTIPIFALLVGAVLGLDALSWRKVIGITIAGGGVVYLIDPFRADFSRATTIGNLLIIANSLAYGAYIALSKDLVRRHGALTVITWLFVMGCVFTVPLGAGTLAETPMLGWGWEVWIALLYIILVPTVGAYYLNAWALARVEPSTVAVYIYLQPLIAFALAPFILGEAWNERTIVACVLIFAGVLVVTRRGRSRAIAEVAEHPEALGH